VELLDTFAAGYGFPLDGFQVAGITSLAEGRSVLVAAPTGAGKTVVGEFAVWLALERGGKCFYTTPIKALSNQKFADLSRRHGADRVGLLTGDNSINGEAPVVVMTTEVLRNMLYEGSRTLVGLHAVVLDEVHYLADPERGAVWEEVVVQLPPSVQLACLSATVSNAEEFGAWLSRVRAATASGEAVWEEAGGGACDVVISERRPVPLEHHYAVNERIYPIFAAGTRRAGADAAKARSTARRQTLPGTPNPELLMLERRSGPTYRTSRRGRRQHSGIRLRPPRRSSVVEQLRGRKWLPAIYFLFSRAGCDDAVAQVVADGVCLTTPKDQDRIRALVEERTADLAAEDLAVLGYHRWLEALERGVAAHHAGMVPAFKEAVEDLFVRGLVKVCFATETLALGINMPARTVVIERLEKWSGQRHELLTPGQFTQLTGRAGRRGLDTSGHAVVVYQRDIDFLTVASLVGRRTEPLRSSFAPSYNMAVNLLRRHDRAEAERLLARSFAQFQIDRSVAGDEARLARYREALTGYADRLSSDLGDFSEYWSLRRELSQLESEAARERKRLKTEAVEAAIAELREGDVVAMPGTGPAPVLAAIVSRTESRAGTPLAGAVTEDRKLVRLGPREFRGPPVKLGRVRLPSSGGPRQSSYRKEVALALRSVDPRPAPLDGDGDAQAATPDSRERIDALRRAVRDHPIHGDPNRSDIEIWAHRHDDLLAEAERLQRSLRRRTGSLVRQFDRIVSVLTDLGYLSGPAHDPKPTADGLILAGLYAETDLVLAEALRRGLLTDLDEAALAAVASVFVHETRAPEPPPPRFPSPAVRDTVDSLVEVWEEVVNREEAASLPPTRPLDAGFADITWRWAQGADLDDALAGEDRTAGDFVRGTKQVADLLRQIRDSVPDTDLAARAGKAARELIRGVVAYTGLE
jgi:ATP-dependent RNA helicase HelY